MPEAGRDRDRRGPPAAVQLVGIGCAVGVADHPVQQWVAEEAGGQVVETVPVDDDVGLGGGVDGGLRDDPPGQVHDRRAVGQRELLDRAP